MAGDGASLEWQSYIRGHHAYCMLWTPSVSEMLMLRSLFDCHAVAMKNDLLVGHISRPICRVIFGEGLSQWHLQSCQKPSKPWRANWPRGTLHLRFYGRQLYINKLRDLLVNAS